jgi:uncharacterized protein (TIGR04255 family)
MTEYLPFHDKHSIQEAQISILFLGQFDRQSIEATRGFVQAELSDELPRTAEVRGGSLRIDITNPAAPSPLGGMQSDLVGFLFSKVQGNGQPARVLQLADNALSVSFMDYDSWQATRNDALRYLRPALASLPLDQNPAVAFSLRFIDRYTFSGNSKDARADMLFVSGTPHITPHTFDAGPNWHCNTGWFDIEIGEEKDRILHNLNVTSNLVDLSSTVTINHHATRYLTSPRYSAEVLLESDSGAIGMADAVENLHEQNKSILKHLLVREMLSKVGLLP